ncbi:hypothetical protein [Glycomyces artemisiae]|uniref:MspA protein n=1 Tax=Glycomyces artemisiae TaxID=1076443 RepID=A0A2T0UWY3_9ACTN|nr:hypothetical protein [Glycomyces artemisiae]PRY62441.1 hypothetical protein B0I28_101775 [Glycomyces artemisiae]
MPNARPVRSFRLRHPERLRRLAAAAAAVPVAALIGAAGASAAPPQQLDVVPDLDAARIDLSGRASISLLDTGDELYGTGKLKGDAELAVPSPEGYSEIQDLFLHRKRGSGGDFGDVDVMIGPDRGESLHCDDPGIIDFATGLAFDVRKLPRGFESGGDPITLVTDPFVLEPAVPAEGFPPVNQQYTLEDSVALYQETGPGQYEQIGLLEGFDVIVNQSAAR